MTSLAYAALWLFVFALPWENLLVIPGLGTVTKISGILALGLTLFSGLISGRFRRPQSFHVAAVLFVVLSGTVLFINYTATRLPMKFGTYVQLVIVLWLVWELAPTRQRLQGLLMAFVFGAYLAAFHAIMAYRMHVGVFRRFTGEGFDANELANIFALAIPIAWYLGVTYKRVWLRHLCRGFLVIGLIGIGLTASRGGMLAGVVGLLVVPLTMTSLSPGKLATGIFLLGISGALAVKYVPTAAVERLASTKAEIEGGGLGGRMRVWRAGVEAYLDAPVFGHGAGSFPVVVEPILGTPRASHNSFLTVLVDQGIVGLSLFLTMFIAIFLALLRLPVLERRVGLVVLATLFVAMVPLPWEDSKVVWFVLAALIGLANAKADAPVRVSQAVNPPYSRGPMPAPMSSHPGRRAQARFRTPTSADGDAPA